MIEWQIAASASEASFFQRSPLLNLAPQYPIRKLSQARYHSQRSPLHRTQTEAHHGEEDGIHLFSIKYDTVVLRDGDDVTYFMAPGGHFYLSEAAQTEECSHVLSWIILSGEGFLCRAARCTVLCSRNGIGGLTAVQFFHVERAL